ncbi:MAG: FISUMP domain-containing protein [Bacteroidota bacterium]
MKIFPVLCFITLCMAIAAQGQIIELKFTSLVYGSHVDLDSVRVRNITHPGDTVLYWPDTTLMIGYLGVEGPLNDQFSAFNMRHSSANPVIDKADIQIFLPAGGYVFLRITDISGSLILEMNQYFSAGSHVFRYYPSKPGISIISARYQSEVKSLKLIYTGSENRNNQLNYMGTQSAKPITKSVSSSLPFLFYPGDTIQLQGWHNGQNAILNTAPVASKDYAFMFGLNYPCPGLPQFEYGGQVYNTVQIGTQCWMKENLNIGIKVNSIYIPYLYHYDMHNDGKIEKYCFNNDTANCTVYGGIYEWNEIMQYQNSPGIQGICALGWHIPTNEEWCTLASYLDSTVTCSWGANGTFVADKLKETGIAHWYSFNLSASNESGFTALAASYRHPVGEWPAAIANQRALFWTSSTYSLSSAWAYSLGYNISTISKLPNQMQMGESVRCILDY